MRLTSARKLLLALVMITIGVVPLVPRTASAAPCCSAPICQMQPPAPICAFCSPGCAVDEDDSAAAPVDYAHDFDAAAGVCYAVE
jgi:hypothetical protein